MIGSKTIKPGGAEPDGFEQNIAQALLELEANADLKLYLRDLHITQAREVDFGNKKLRLSSFTCPFLSRN
ncbi:small ribosomal subunit protein eS7-like isoform 1-T4 [Glossina fuscipes fuscipes]